MHLDTEKLGLEEREVLMAFALGAQRCDARAVELSNCRTCADRPDRYLRAAEILRKLIANTMGEDNV